MDVYIKEGRVYGLLKNRKILKLTLDNQKRDLGEPESNIDSQWKK